VPLSPGYVTVAVLRMAATNPTTRNVRVSSETNVVDNAGNLWTPAAEETSLFDGAPSQHRAVWYSIVTSLLPGDRITVMMPAGLSFDRAAATASFWHINFNHPDINFHLARWTSGKMWHSGFEALLAHGIDAHAIGRRLKVRLSVDEGGVRGNATARAMVPNTAHHDDAEAILRGLLLLKNARRQLPSSNSQWQVPSRPAAEIRVVA
jgi:hypothetical protein